MHLLNVHTRKLEYFGDTDVPLYAILSHTWGVDEVTFQDIQGPEVQKAGYEKVKKTCDLACSHGFHYVWIDTCCIDKSSSAELSEAINSMYRWYQQATICYAYLSDVGVVDRTRYVPAASEGHHYQALRGNRWFTRGWTLQELIAPSVIIFFDQNWRKIGKKSSLQQALSEITGIPSRALLGEDLQGFCVAQKMSWAANRKTSRLEDRAYSLMGLFGVNMPLLYGEGQKAFRRLQEEILKVTHDYSILAWNPEAYGVSGPLATSPDEFQQSRVIVSDPDLCSSREPILVDSKGVHLEAPMLESDVALLPCRYEGAPSEFWLTLRLQPLPDSKKQFKRRAVGFVKLKPEEFVKLPMKRICLRVEQQVLNESRPLFEAATRGNTQLLKTLLGTGCDPLESLYNRHSPLGSAVAARNRDMVELLLKLCPDFDYMRIGSLSLLEWALQSRHHEIAGLLLKFGANPNQSDRDGYTPLFKADQEGVRLLIEAGAEIDFVDGGGKTALSLAACNGDTAKAQTLLRNGASVHHEDIFGITPLSLAVQQMSEDSVRLLLEHGADPTSKDHYGITPLMRAIGQSRSLNLPLRCLATVRALLEWGGPGPTITEDDVKKALHWAKNERDLNTDVIELLERYLHRRTKRKRSLSDSQSNGRTRSNSPNFNDRQFTSSVQPPERQTLLDGGSKGDASDFAGWSKSNIKDGRRRSERLQLRSARRS